MIDYHYFASSHTYWTTDKDLDRCIEKQVEKDTSNNSYVIETCSVYRVPLPADAHYDVENFRPNVEGVEHVKQIQY